MLSIVFLRFTYILLTKSISIIMAVASKEKADTHKIALKGIPRSRVALRHNC